MFAWRVNWTASANQIAMTEEQVLRRFVVCVIGARLDYAIPRILQDRGWLHRYYTDLHANHWVLAWLRTLPVGLFPVPLRRFLTRQIPGVPPNKIKALTRFGVEYKCRSWLSGKHPAQAYATHLWAGRAFCRSVLRAGMDGATDVYAMSSAALEVLVEARRRGIRTVLEQPSAPCAVEIAIMAKEHEQWPAWEERKELTDVFERYSRREQEEWQHADIILCPSQFVADGIQLVGGPVERCRIVPYGVDLPNRRAKCEMRKTGSPLRVLSVGAVRLQKGVQYALEAAMKTGARCEFRWVGPVMVKPIAEKLLRSRLQLTGAVPRFEVEKHYDWADVFLLPSLSEGSATVVYEALARGIPVICTPNTGSVVRDGIEGCLVPIRNSSAIAECLERLAADPDFRARLAANAYARAKEYSLASYGKRLLAALAQT